MGARHSSRIKSKQPGNAVAKNQDKPTAHKLSWRWTCTSTRRPSAQRSHEQPRKKMRLAWDC